ncbi:hypothetical protein HN747_03160 [archaeon]|jgi:hypothetical protein|nr:hypothetical protein [archaeon]
MTKKDEIAWEIADLVSSHPSAENVDGWLEKWTKLLKDYTEKDEEDCTHLWMPYKCESMTHGNGRPEDVIKVICQHCLETKKIHETKE